jgi:hypothetical protein
MATTKEQHDARPGARNVGEGGARTTPREAARPESGERPDPPRDIRRADADPESPDAPNPT